MKYEYTSDSTVVTFSNAQEDGKSPEEKPYTVSFNNLFLRDASTSEMSVDPISKQKRFSTGSILSDPKHTQVKSMTVTPDKQGLEITWMDGDSSVYPLEFFYKYKGSSFITRSMRKQWSNFRPVLWNKESFLHGKGDETVTCEAFLTDDNVLFKTLINLQKYGLAFITDVPKPDGDECSHIASKICERIGPIRKTIYGEVFDFKNNDVPSLSENAKFVNSQLPLHMDLQFMEHAPGFQVLHCLKNSNKKNHGTHTFVDSFYATRLIREGDHEAYEALQHVPINYKFEKNDARYYQSKPLVEQYDSNELNTLIGNYEYLIKRVNYSPPFQAPFTYGIYNKLPQNIKDNELTVTPAKLTERFLFKEFLRGLESFEKSINMKENQYKVNLAENSCVIFNNNRILHSRYKINNEEERWFKGCFFDTDSFRSRLMFLEEKFH